MPIFVDLWLLLAILITVLELLLELLSLRHVVELLALAVRRVLVLLLLAVTPLVSSLEHVTVEVYLDAWILVLNLV